MQKVPFKSRNKKVLWKTAKEDFHLASQKLQFLRNGKRFYCENLPVSLIYFRLHVECKKSDWNPRIKIFFSKGFVNRQLRNEEITGACRLYIDNLENKISDILVKTASKSIQ